VFIRLLVVFGAVIYIFAAIGSVAYLEASMFWLIPVLGPAIYFIFKLPDITPAPTGARPVAPYMPSPDVRARINARIEELQNGPPHRHKTQYIDSVSRGIPYSNERIDYLEFPRKLVLCEHLRPLESVMRAEKLHMEHIGEKRVEVRCILWQDAIRERYPLEDCVEFKQGPGVDNHAPSINIIHCKNCGDSIEEEGLYGARWPER